MAFIFLLFIFSDFIKAETIHSYSFSEVNKLDVISQKELSKSSEIFAQQLIRFAGFSCKGQMRGGAAPRLTNEKSQL